MEHDLLGYLLNSLDRHEHERVESHLRTDADAQAQLAGLRQALSPLALDRSIEPPAGLAARTMARIPQAPLGRSPSKLSPPIAGFVLPGRRLIELTVAAACLLTLTGLGALWIAKMRGLQPGGEAGVVPVVECKNNLQKLFMPLRAYADSHRGEYPNVATVDASPRNAVAMVFPILKDAKLLRDDAQIACPGAGCTPPRPTGVEPIKSMTLADFQEWAAGMLHTYAYSLGYRQEDKLVALRLGDGHVASLMPLMADSPPGDLSHGNSPAHNGRGQNVLYADGHVTFCPSRHVGYEQDDIYLNRKQVVSAGVDWRDTVLACGAAKP